MSARFFVDETDLALGKALATQYGDVVYPGHPDLPSVTRGSLDDEWLPLIGKQRLVVITRDQKIRYRSGRSRHGSTMPFEASCSPAAGASRRRRASPC